MSDDIKKAAGRPRKYVELEETELPKVDVSQSISTVSSDLNCLALGMAKDDTNNWCVYSFKFNPQTKEVSFVDVKKSFSKVGATFDFKKKAVEILK